MASYIDLQIDSRYRADYPDGLTYSFVLPHLNTFGLSTNYQVVLQSAEIPNQYNNVFTNVNDKLFFTFTTPPSTYDTDATEHFILATTGNYDPTEWANGLQTALMDARPAQWQGHATPPTFAVVFDDTQAYFKFTFTTGFGVQFHAGVDETDAFATGFPQVKPSARVAEMLGLHRYYKQYKNSGPIVSTVSNPDIYGDTVSLSGSKYVTLVGRNFLTNNFSINPILSGHILGCIPLKELGTVASWQRNDTDRGSSYIEGINLAQLVFELYDQWGNLFILPTNQNISFILRLYPSQSSDYSG